MLKIDFHTHSTASVHALNTVEELLRQADKNGMEGIAVTDHSPGIDNTIWLIQNQLDSANWRDNIKGPDIPYFMTLLFRYRQPSDLKVHLFKGIECNILSNGTVATDVPRFIAGQFDIVIASVHPLPSLFKMENSEQLTERMIMAMDEPIDIIGHPFHRNYCPYMEPIVQAAAEKEIALEMNEASMRMGKADSDQVKSMLKLAKGKDCRISLSSDAHMTNELGNDENIRRMLEETDFPKELIVNHSMKYAVDFIQERKKVRKNVSA
ncbi:MAG: PHP domain-containing protein [Proteobacteria bacterium]|nr:PHP domain-containing protein [Pseudomonadota bacterium]